jgi:hypothetical protein
MPNYQNTTVDSNKLILGNYKMETAATAGGTYVNLGAGMLTRFGHEWDKYDVQAGNAPDPIEGIAKESFKIEFELMEYDGSALSALFCGAVSETNTSVLSTMIGGGNQVLTPRAFRFTNTRIIGTTTCQTILTVFKATVDAGLSITAKGDNDSDPINVMPITLTAEVDATKTAGTQLFSLTRTKVA